MTVTRARLTEAAEDTGILRFQEVALRESTPHDLVGPSRGDRLPASGFHRGLHMTVQIICRSASSLLLAIGFVATQVQASGLGRVLAAGAARAQSNGIAEKPGAKAPMAPQKLIVIGFMGGNVRPDNLVHREARLTQDLQLGYPSAIHAEIFANSRGEQAFRRVLELLGKHGQAPLSQAEKMAARIVIFGHSWGASETVTLANRLNRVGVPVLLTIQVDSVQKQRQNDADIPPNVQEAVNFYQADGMLRGRNLIVAEDPRKTKILGNYESSYRQNDVSCAGFPWYARAFMKAHIQIENDPAVWNHIESLILAKLS